MQQQISQKSTPNSTFVIRRKSDDLPERYYQVRLISRHYVQRVKEALEDKLEDGCYIDETQVNHDLDQLDEPPAVQTSLFGEDEKPPTGAELRDKSISLVHSSHEDWVDLAVREIRKIEGGMTFTTDDLWDKLPSPPEPRAMGAAIRTAVKDDLIISTKSYKPSRRPACHSRPILVWMRSL